MKAVVYERYGPPEVLKLTNVPKPSPADNEVLIRVIATTVTVGDSRMRSFRVPAWQWLFARLYLGVFRPKRATLGMELSGVIEAVGKDVTRFKAGDEVFGATFNADFGGYAEYKCLPEDGELAIKPDNLSFEEAAAAVGGGVTALRLLRRANIQPGQKVLVYGASGAVGTNAVQIARNHFEAEVTGVCSTSNLDLVRSLGAAHVVDYTREDFTKAGPVYDVVLDSVARFPPSRARQALKPGGIYLNVHRHTGTGKDRDLLDELRALREMLVSEQVRPVIDRCYPMEQIVEAHRYVDQGHKKGNVAIQVKD